MGSTAEIRRLQNCINDLVSVLALPAIWSGGESSHILGTLLDVLLTMLRLDFVYARLSDVTDGPPIALVRLGNHGHSSVQPQQFGQALDPWLKGDQTASKSVVPNPAGHGEISIASFSLGFQHEVGVLVAGSSRADFPTEVERLLLRVAANQAAIGLHEARRSGEQKRVAGMLEERVAERTKQLTSVNNELRRSEAYLAEAQRLSRTGSFGWKPSTGEIIWSEETFRIFQYDRSTKPTAELVLKRVHPEDRAKWQEATDRAISEKSHYEAEFRILLPDGTVKYVRTVGHPVLDASGDLVQLFGSTMDISASKRAEEALSQSREDLARINRVTTMGELTASLAHEVNQPIAAAVTNANSCIHWLAGDAPNLEKARAAAMRIVKDGTRAAEIISRIRLLFQKGTPEWQLVDVNEIIGEMILLLSGETTRYSISLRTALAADLPRVRGDRVQLQQVLMNLMTNSIDAMKGVEGTRELVINSQREENEQLVVSVSDTGVGLPPQQGDQIFDAFFTTKPHGTGMGLRICRSIVESHGGRLWAANNSPRGASFFFTLPTKSEALE